jgi:S-DNA-T family DNA segregation ATPase FtsK/SpoIIIE
MAEDGIVGQYNGSQAREVLITVQQWEEMSTASTAGSASAGTAHSLPTSRVPRTLSVIPETRKTSPPARGKSVGSDHEGSDEADEDLLDEDNDGTDEFEEDGDLVEEVELEDDGELDDSDEYDQDDEEPDEEEPEPKHTTPNRRRSHRSTA